jgi:hypothetical protein
MKYNEYNILEAKINKNLIGDTVILKPTNSKTSNMPIWFKVWSETQFEPRIAKIETTLSTIIKLNNLKTE